MSLKFSVLLRSSLFAFDELRRALGNRRALRVLLEVGRRNATGAPFKKLPPATDPRDQATRDELAPAVNLYQVLQDHLPEPRALEVARRIILNSSLFHLRATYPDFHRGNFLDLVEGDPGVASSRLATDFAFADTRVLEITEEKAAFDVEYCRIPGTLELVGAERLAPIFCEVDAVYFPIYEPDVVLTRPHTIVHGDAICDFRLEWRQDS